MGGESSAVAMFVICHSSAHPMAFLEVAGLD